MFGSKRTTATAGVLLFAAVLVFAACGGGGTTVDVTLQEFAIGTDPVSVPAGSITFEVTNEGPDDVHEFVVISTELGLTDLPTAADGSVDEEGGGMEVLGEIEDIAVGDTQTLTLDLDSGSYVLICNIVETEDMEGHEEVESHYQEGMRTSFTAE